MAPNTMTNIQSKKQSFRLIQPALPLVPGKKPQKAKPVAAGAGSEVVELEAPAQGLPNGGTHHEQTQAVEVGSSPSVLQNGDHGSNEVSLIADSLPATSPTAVAEDVAKPDPHDIDKCGKEEEEKEEGEMDTGLASQHVNGEDTSEPSKSDPANPAIQLPDQETVAEQDNDIVTEGQISELANSASGDGDSEGQVPTQATHQAPAQTDPATSVYANGIGSPHFMPTELGAFVSQQEQITQDYDLTPTVATAEDGHAPTVNGYQPPLTTPLGLPATVPRPFNALPSLAEHLLLLNATKEGADIIIQVNPSKTQPFVSYSHSIILLRSLRLRRLVTRQQQAANNYAGNVITLYPARYVMPHAFEAALRYLYSDTVLGKDFFAQPHAGSDYQTIRVHNLDYLLSYWVSGIELGLEPISICAESLLKHYLDWDILEITYKYAMELADSPNLPHGKIMTGSDYLVASSTIIKLILKFLADQIDFSTFKLDTAPAQNLIPARLPQLDDGRHKHNPALAAMVFGSMPSSADMSPSSPQSEILSTPATFKDTVASNILLNVDFENLFTFNNFIHASTIRDAATTKLMTDLVNEREIRRQKVHSSRVTNQERMAHSTAWESVGIRESILDTNVLHRDRVGFLASGASK